MDIDAMAALDMSCLRIDVTCYYFVASPYLDAPSDLLAQNDLATIAE